PAPPPDPRIPRDRLVRRVLTAAGLSEAVTFGFIESNAAEPFVADRSADAVFAVSNPLSAKFDTLRPSLLPGLVDSVGHNRRHGGRGGGPLGVRQPFSTGDGWDGRGGRGMDGGRTAGALVRFDARRRLFDVKGVAEQLCAALDVP